MAYESMSVTPKYTIGTKRAYGLDFWILYSVCSVFVLLFIGRCYDSLDTLCKIIALILSIACCVLVVMRSYRFKSLETLYIVVIFLFLAFQFTYVEHRYSQSILSSLFGSYYYFFVLLLPVFNYLLDKLGDVYILEVLETTALLLSIFMLVVAVLMNFAGINITQVSKQRENNIRLDAPILVQMMPMISLFLSMNRIGKVRKHVLALFCCMLALIYVGQSRWCTLLIIACLALMILLQHRKNAALLFVYALVLGLVGLALIIHGPLGQLMRSFSVDSVYGASTLTRIYETDYYWELFKANPVNGTGLLTYGTSSYSIITGPFNNFYVDDVGIIGALAVMGLWVIPTFIIPFIILIHSIARKPQWKGLGWPIALYILGTMFALLITFPYFDPFWVLTLAFFCSKRNV
ncbi:hypothetical protein PG2010B_1597 [Bifidobacterium animalis subsp. lactis]|uniref:O-antigen ligase family protein n=1 Tax=Bifidobacterium animalis TaxID=28025 RepID=UPI00102134DC|nr:O-antigen ligase family protein [Bifidobacterium animalis]RYM91160.1 hypothetical protein PG2010B_1597 [Bifidobacterium animalis subsp. lactis]